jgi:hypothetical protein
MNKKRDVHYLVLEYFLEHNQAEPGPLSRQLNVSRVSIHRVLKDLLTQGKLTKYGSTPWVVYIYNKNWQPKIGPELPKFIAKYLPPSIIE